jgi:uncharacterized protein (DUF433 family)
MMSAANDTTKGPANPAITSPAAPELSMVAYALRHPRGRYSADRASQLSGVPKSTMYDWRRDGVLVPDFTSANPATWSYRDLVFLRLLAWLRQGGMDRSLAKSKVDSVREQLSNGVEVRRIHATRWDMILNDLHGESLPDDRENLLPSTEFHSLLGTFDLHEPIEELRTKRNHPIWAPDLVTPSAYSAISPWVLAGDPCVSRTRIPTAALYALRTERSLSTAAIVSLYPGLTPESVDDVINLERRLHGGAEPIAA